MDLWPAISNDSTNFMDFLDEEDDPRSFDEPLATSDQKQSRPGKKDDLAQFADGLDDLSRSMESFARGIDALSRAHHRHECRRIERETARRRSVIDDAERAFDDLGLLD